MTTATPDRLLQTILALVPHPPSGRFTDTELLRRFVHNGDEDAFAALIARHGSMVLGACRRLLQDAESAEDVAQATFLVLARKASSVRQPEALAGWLHRTACHLALKHRRAETRRRGRETRVSQVSPRSLSDPIDELSNRELLEAIDEEIQRMPEQFRLPVVLCCLEGRTLEETSKRLDWTLGSVKGRLERGRAELRDRLIRRGFALSAACLGLDVMREGARASLPAGFGAATLRAAVGFTSPVGNLGGVVASIAESGLRGATVFTRKVILSFLLVVGILGGGVAAVGPPAQPKAEARARPAPLQPVEKPRVDRQGDALPAGALARLGTVRWRSAEVVDAIAFSPDGKTLAVASRHGVRFFDMNGKRTREIRNDEMNFYSLAFSPDSARLACRGILLGDRSRIRDVVRIWDLGAIGKQTEYALKGVHWAGWSAKGEPLAVREEKDEVVVQELTSGKERRIGAKDLYDPRFRLFRCAYAPASKVLAHTDSRAAIHVWNVSTGKKLCTLETKERLILSMALSPDGRSLASLTSDAGDNKRTVQVWDVATGKKTHAVANGQRYLEKLVFTPDGKTLATVGVDVRFWDPSTGRERSRVQNLSRYFDTKFAFSPDSKTLATASYSATIRLWDVATGESKPTSTGHSYRPGGITFSADGKWVATSDGTVIVWNSATGEPMTVVSGGDWIQGDGFSANGSRFSCYVGDQFVVYDTSSGRPVNTSKSVDPFSKKFRESSSINLSEDRKTLYALSGRKDDSDPVVLTAWNAKARKQLFRRSVGLIHLGTAIVSPDIRLLAREQGNEETPGGRPVRVEDFETGELRQTLPQLLGQSCPLAFSPDGRLLVTYFAEVGKANRASALKLWEVATAGELLSLPTVMNSRVAFSPDSRVLAMSAPAREIVLWDLRRAKELQRIKGFDADVTSLAFSPDGRRLISGLSDSTLLVWEVKKPAKFEPLDAEGVAKAWADLLGDPRKAFAARGSLADSPAEAVALLKRRLETVGAVRPVDPKQLRRLLDDLDGDSFAVREKAQKELESLGDRASEALRKAIEKKPSAEARKRIQALLRRLNGPIPDRETLRAVRAIGALEDIGTREAKAILETLAGGVPGARRTQEAKAALRRMGHASATKP